MPVGRLRKKRNPQKITNASISDIQTVGGFLDVCGRKGSELSKENAAVLKTLPPSEFPTSLYKAMDAAVTDRATCVAYLTGLVDGWKEGHEHGVTAAHFPGGFPRDLSAALKSLPVAELQAASAEMTSDVPCLPDHITMGETVRTVVEYIGAQTSQNPLLRLVPTSRMVPAALVDAFPCSKPSGKP